jgi:hypothetical protein
MPEPWALGDHHLRHAVVCFVRFFLFWPSPYQLAWYLFLAQLSQRRQLGT